MPKRNNRPRFQFVVSGASASVIALAVTQSATGSVPTGLSPPPVRYVDDDAPPGGDGLSWPTAYTHLQDALAEAAQPGSGVIELRVGQGMYRPDRGAGQTSGDRSASFQLLEGVAVHGAYAGFGAPDPDERDVELFVTVLSGDLAGDDEPNFVNYDENSYHVASAITLDRTALLDGVAITAGNADGSGSDALGGGLLAFQGSPTVILCAFQGNLASFGGAVSTAVPFGHPRSEPVFIACTFSQNAAVAGGAISAAYSDMQMVSCSFLSNSAAEDGGAVCGVSSNLSCVNCLFAANTAGPFDGCGAGRGGALYSGLDPHTQEYSEQTIVNCTFVANDAVSGGAICNIGHTRARVMNSILWDCGLSPLVTNTQPLTAVHFCDIQGGWSGPGGNNIDADPMFVSPSGGVFELSSGSPCIDAGWNNAVPPDWSDLDGDEDRAEFTPLDLAGRPCFVDDPATPDTGCGSPALTDMGAFEFQTGSVLQPVPGDLDGDQLVGAVDLALLLGAWVAGGGCLADLNADGAVDVLDLMTLLALWS